MSVHESTCPGHDSKLASTVAEFCVSEPSVAATEKATGVPSVPAWRRLTEVGTTLWLDTGDLDAARALWAAEFEALTTNNTLLNNEVQKGIYDALVPRAAALLKDAETGLDDGLLVQEIAFILNAVHGLKLVRAFDADVSVELHTNLARDAEASYRYGKRYAAICPQRFIVKVPLTPEGVLAARRLHDDGVRINFTLGFSARENYLIGAVARPDWVNVFMGRCNAFVAGAGLGSGDNVGEKATLASQRLMRRLRDERGCDVRQIGASMRNGDQAFDLAGLDVYTMPTAVAAAYLERDPDPADVEDRTAADPVVELSEGRSAEAEGLDALWTLSDSFAAAVHQLAEVDARVFTGAEMLGLLRDHGAGDLFAELSGDEAARIAADGKIPAYAPWIERVRAKTASWDGLLTDAALASFTADQAALDQRIRGLL